MSSTMPHDALPNSKEEIHSELKKCLIDEYLKGKCQLQRGAKPKHGNPATFAQFTRNFFSNSGGRVSNLGNDEVCSSNATTRSNRLTTRNTAMTDRAVDATERGSAPKG